MPEASRRLVELFPTVIVESVPVIVLLVDPAGRIEYVNSYMEAVSGRPLSDVSGADWLTTYLPSRDYTTTRAAFSSLLEGVSARTSITGMDTASGHERTIAWRGRPLRDREGVLAGILYIGEDVTGQSEAKRIQLENEQRVRKILDGMFAFVGLYDLDGNLVEANRPPLELAGLTREQVLGKPFWEAYWWSHAAETQQQVRDALARATRGETVRGDFLVRIADDQFITLDTKFGPLLGKDGRVEAIIGSGVDVTEQRHAQEELRLHSQVLMSMSEGVLFIDGDAVIRFTNPALERMFGYGDGELAGRHVTVLNDATTAENAQLQAKVMAALQARGTFEGELPSRRKDGTTFVSWARITPLSRPGPVMWVSIQRDITEEKRAEARLRASLREKETLLREVHHRVKNNLQVISSLLHFQAKRVHSPADLAAFEDGRKRLLAMILVHEQLYQSEQFSCIGFGDYIRALVAALVTSFDGGPRIDVTVNADELRVPIEAALPAGMILCELITNVYKYAFPEVKTGSARIDVCRTAEHVVMAVVDDGAGFPPDFDPQASRTFGWQLINMLTRQLGGCVTVTPTRGARVEVRFPLPADDHAECACQHPESS